VFFFFFFVFFLFSFFFFLSARGQFSSIYEDVVPFIVITITNETNHKRN